MDKENINELLNLLENKKIIELRDELSKLNEADIAEFLEEIGELETLAVFRILPKDIASEVFSYFDVDTQQNLLEAMTNTELTEIVDKLYIDDVVDLLEELPANIVKKIMLQIKPEKRGIINQFLQYKEYTAGSIMTAEFIDIRKKATVKDALEKIRRIGMKSETIYTLYITDQTRKLEGFVTIRSLLINKPETKIEDLIEEDVIFVKTSDDQEKVANLFIKYGFLAIPVVDNEERLVGVVTFDDAMDVIEEEDTEDFEKMAAIAPSEKPYIKASVWEIAKSRFSWLLILLLTATLTGSILEKFEEMLTAVIGAVAFLPMLTDAGGNAGSQSSTIVTRGLAIGEIKENDYFKVFLKELGTSIIVGLGLAIINYLRMIIFGDTSTMAFTVSLTLFSTIILANTVGGLLPLLAVRFKMDPAVMAAPLITTIVDTLSLLIYVMFVMIFLF